MTKDDEGRQGMTKDDKGRQRKAKEDEGWQRTTRDDKGQRGMTKDDKGRRRTSNNDNHEQDPNHTNMDEWEQDPEEYREKNSAMLTGRHWPLWPVLQLTCFRVAYVRLESMVGFVGHSTRPNVGCTLLFRAQNGEQCILCLRVDSRRSLNVVSSAEWPYDN